MIIIKKNKAGTKKKRKGEIWWGTPVFFVNNFNASRIG